MLFYVSSDLYAIQFIDLLIRWGLYIYLYLLWVP